MVSMNFSIKWNTVLILGNWSYKNLGDELILLGTLRKLQEQKKNIIISCYDPQWLSWFFEQFEDLDFSKISYLHEFPKWFRSFFRYFFSPCIRELKKYSSANAIIIWGWEIITEESPHAYRYWTLGLIPYFFKYFFSTIQTLWKGGKFKIPVYLMWGIQEPKSRKNKFFFSLLLKFVSYFYTRDEESTQLGKKEKKASKLVMDTSIFAYKWREKKEVEKKTEKKEKYIILNLNKNWENFLDAIVQDCKKFVKEWYKLYYCPISYGKNNYYNDNIYKEKIEKKLKTQLIPLYREEDFSEFVKKIRNAELVINTRLHLFLISSFIGTKNKVYPYQKKILKMQRLLSENQDIIIPHLLGQ